MFRSIGAKLLLGFRRLRFATALASRIIDNGLFPDHWFAQCAECDNKQQLDIYRHRVLQTVLCEAGTVSA
ncbi:MAG: hypothetical protein J7M14_02195 [Planctomycetes bacterium]|nr:hypothetical protein [Planctomycetota bacterium]